MSIFKHQHVFSSDKSKANGRAMCVCVCVYDCLSTASKDNQHNNNCEHVFQQSKASTKHTAPASHQPKICLTCLSCQTTVNSFDRTTSNNKHAVHVLPKHIVPALRWQVPPATLNSATTAGTNSSLGTLCSVTTCFPSTNSLILGNLHVQHNSQLTVCVSHYLAVLLFPPPPYTLCHTLPNNKRHCQTTDPQTKRRVWKTLCENSFATVCGVRLCDACEQQVLVGDVTT
eukprot:m.192757 g.192757  ORF g.192757 m.192757 type:complete len:229 (+) comp14864_c1_seq1:2906-3592(+)